MPFKYVFNMLDKKDSLGYNVMNYSLGVTFAQAFHPKSALRKGAL